MFSVEFSSDSEKFLKRAERKVVDRVLDKIEKLKEDPFPHIRG